MNSPPASQPDSRLRWWYRYIPALDSLRTYNRFAFTSDLMAGLTVATFAVPQGMAYATLAGLPAQYGLYTAIVMTAVGALLDSSKQLINGPTNAISIALLSALVLVPESERIAAATVVALLVGSIQLGIALLRLGDLSRFISHSVIVGFTIGASTLLVLDQSKHLFGLKAVGEVDDHFLIRASSTLSQGSIHWPTFVIGLGTIASVILIRQINHRLKKHGWRFPIPQHLVAIILMASLVGIFRWDDTLSIQTVGAIPAALPSWQLPNLNWDQVRLLMSNAFAIAVLGLLEAIAMAKSIANRTGQNLDINQQCLSEGAANLAGSFFQCFPGSGSLTRSVVNQQAGAVSQWSGVFAAMAVAATMLLFAPLAQYIPRASLAGLLMLAAFRMVDGRQLWFHFRATKLDAGVILTTAIAAVVISIEFCIVIGVFLSFVLYVPRAAQVRVHALTRGADGRLRERLPEDPPDPLEIYDLEGELFFGTEPEVKKHFTQIEKNLSDSTKAFLLVFKRARNPDAVFLQVLKDFHERLTRRNLTVLLSGVHPEVAQALKNTGLWEKFGAGHVFVESQTLNSTLAALTYAEQTLGCGIRATATSTEFSDYVI